MNFSTLINAAAKKSCGTRVSGTFASLLMACVLTLVGLNSFAQVATDGDYRTRSTGALNWSGTTTWQVRAASSWANTTTPPTTSANVYIQAGSAVTVDVALAVCKDIHVQVTTGVLTIGNNKIEVSGKLRGYTGTAVFSTGVDGTFYSGQVSSTSPTATCITSNAGTGKMSFVGSSRAITVTGEWGATSTGFDTDINLTAGQTATPGTNMKAANWTMTSGILDCSTTARVISADNGTTGGSVSVSNGFVWISAGSPVLQRTGSTSAASLTLNSGAILRLTATSPTIASASLTFNGTVDYNRAGIQTLVVAVQGGVNPNTYNNLTFSGTSAKTLGLSTIVNGTLSLQGTTSLALGAFTLTYGGSSILEYAGSGIQTATITEWPATSGPINVTVNNSNGFRLPFSRTLTGDFRVLAGDVQNLSGTGVTLTMSGTAASLQVNGSITGTNVGAGNDINLAITGTQTTLSGSGSLVRFLSASVGSSSKFILSRTLQLMFNVSNAINGTLQINTGGFVDLQSSAVLTYGGSSTLLYNTTYSTTPNEFPVTGVNNVSVAAPVGTSIVTLDADKTITGTFAIGAHTVNGGNSINAGSITIGTGSLVAGILTTSTAFTCSGASAISLSGSWNVTGFTKSTSTVNFTGTGSLNNATNFYNLTNSAGTRSITTNFDVENILLLSGGQMGVTGGTGRTLTMSGANSTINIAGGSMFGTDAGAGNDLSLVISGTQTTLTGNATGVNDDEKKFFNVTVNAGRKLILSRGILCKYGTFTVDGTLQINVNGYVNTSGAYSGNAKSPAYHVTNGSLIYNSGGSYTSAGEWPAVNGPANVTLTGGSTLILSADRTVPGILALADNLVTTNAFTITIGVSGSLTRTIGYINGKLRRAVATGPSVTVFHIGDALEYTPVTLNFAAGTGAGMLTANSNVPNAAPAAGNAPTGSGISQTKYINRSWTLSNSTVTTPSYSASFTFIDPDDIIGGANTNALIVAKNNGGTWSNPGVASSVSPTVTTVAGLTSFSDFYLGESGCIAPTALNYTLNTVSYCENVAITTNSPTFTGDAATSYSVSPALPAGLIFNTTNGNITGTPTVPTAAADYTVTVNNACGSTTKNVNITINPNSTLTLTSGTGSNNQAACNGAAITPITYSIGGGATGAGVTGLPAGVTGVFNLGVLTISGTPSGPGVSNFTVTTTGGVCAQASLFGSITSNAAPTLNIVKTNVSQCVSNNGSISVTPVGGVGPYNYSWTGVIGSGNPATTPYPNPGNVSSVSGLTIGFYNVSVTDQNACPVTVSNIHVAYAYSVYVSNNGSNSSTCAATGSIILYGNAGVLPYSFALVTGSGQPIPSPGAFGPTNNFTSLAAGPYTAFVKDAAGCVTAKDISVASAAPLVVNPYVVGASSCAPDGSIQIYRTGGIPPYMYSITSATGPWVNSNIYTGLAAGPYTAYVKDAAGCVGSQVVNVAQGVGLTVNANKTNTSTCVADGTIQLSVTGGVAPFMYSKDDGASYQSSNSFTGLAAGNYAMKVKDFKNCIGTLNVTINLNPIVVTAYATAASNCATNNGSIQLFRTGGVGPYQYSLDDGVNIIGPSANPNFSGLAPGSYDGYVQDSKGCIGALNAIVVLPNCPRPANLNNRVASRSENMLVTGSNDVSIAGIYPNPSNAEFTLQLKNNSMNKVAIIVTDILGRKVYQAEGNAAKPYRFGNDFMPGTYILQVIQGASKESIKLIKE